MVDQSVDQCAAFVAAGRMDDEVGLLIQDQHILVLIDDINRDVLRDQLTDFFGGEDQVDLVGRLQFVAGFGGASVNIDTLLLDELLKARPAETAKSAA